MIIKKIYPIKDVAENILEDIEKAVFKSEYGEPMSEYHSLADGFCADEACSLMVCAAKETSEDGQSQWYFVHVVDDITGNDCCVHSTNSLDKAEFIELLDSILRSTIDTVAAASTKFKVGDIVEAS